ncbi:hypothetical protein P4I92_20310 [Bacillus cereus]
MNLFKRVLAWEKRERENLFSQLKGDIQTHKDRLVSGAEFYLDGERWIVTGMSDLKVIWSYREANRRAHTMTNQLTGEKAKLNMNHISKIRKVTYNPVTNEVTAFEY